MFSNFKTARAAQTTSLSINFGVHVIKLIRLNIFGHLLTVCKNAEGVFVKLEGDKGIDLCSFN